MSDAPGSTSGCLAPLSPEAKGLVGRFDSLWQTPQKPHIDDFLVVCSEGERLALLVELVHSDLEFRLRAGEPVRVEDYLSRYPQLAERPLVVADLLTAEFRLRCRRDPSHDPADYRRRFPEHATRIDQLAREYAALDTVLYSGTCPSPQLPAEETVSTPPAIELSGYELLGELGRGGMGVVYKARQVSINRIVAVKMILHAEYTEEGERRRFVAEAHALGQLQHPHIVQVYEVAEHRGLPFFSMEYCPGGSLEKQLDGTPWEAGRAGELVQTLAQAVQAAHQAGLVHRDLKPGNVLYTADGLPKVTDFGLVKRLDVPGQTQSGAIVGTPSYMAPEQAAGKGKQVGPAADVYALGAILYELLTGRPPFKAATPLDAVLQVLSEEPVPVRRLQPKVPRDLETICLKCLAKEPHKRYASAAVLAADLDRFQRGESVLARPVGRLERGWRWVRRNPFVTTAAAIVLVTTGIAFGLIIASRDRAVQARGEAERVAAEKEDLARRNAEIAGEKTNMSEANSRLAVEKAGEARKAQREATLLALQQATTLLEQGEIGRGMHLLAKSLDLAARARDTDLERVARANLAAWGAHMHRLRAALPHQAGVAAVAISPTGRVIATASFDRTARLWDTASGEPIGKPLQHAAEVRTVAFTPDGKRVLTAAPYDEAKPAQLWDAATGQPIGEPLRHPGEVQAIAFSPNGRITLTAGSGKDDPKQPGIRGVVRLWKTDTGEPIGEPLLHERRVHAAVFSPDGRLLLTSALDVTYLWDVTTGRLLHGFIGHESHIHALAFAPNGRFFVTASQDGTAGVWESATPRKVLTFRHARGIEAVAISPDNRLVVTGSQDRTAQLWDVTKGQAVGSALAHQAPVVAVAFSPDGRMVATASWDKTVRLWETETGKPIGEPLPHGGEVLAVAFAPSGRSVLAGCGRKEGEARLWDVATGNRLGPVLTHEGSVLSVTFSPDSKRVATTSQDHTARLWDATTGEPIGDPLPHSDQVNAAAFTPDSRIVITASDDATALYWNATTGKPFLADHRQQMILQYVRNASFRYHIGALFASSSGPLDALPFLALSRHNLFDIRGLFLNAWPESAPYHLSLSHHEGHLGSLGEKKVRSVPTRSLKSRQNDEIWGPAKGRPPRVARPTGSPLMLGLVGDPNSREETGPNPNAINALAISPDGRSVVTGCANRNIRLWWSEGVLRNYLGLTDRDRFAGRGGMNLTEEHGSIYAVAFSPDSRVVVSASETGQANLWSTDTGHPIGEPMKHEGPVVAVTFSPDGKMVLTGSGDKTARLWDAVTGRPIGRAMEHQGEVVAVAFSHDGRTLLTGSWDRHARVWETASQTLLGPPLPHEGKVLAVAFSPDTRTVLTGSEDGTARLWDAHTGKPIGPALRHKDEVRTVAFSPDGRTVITGGDDNTAQLWMVTPPLAGDPEQLVLATQVQTGTRLEVHGASHVLPPFAWLQGRNHLSRTCDGPPAGVDALAWHYREAAACEAGGQWPGALWHLDRLVEAAPGSWRLRMRRGNALAALLHWEKAMTDLSAAIQQAPQAWETWYNRGRAHLSLGAWQKSVEDFSKALELKPDHGPTVHDRGFAHAGLSQWHQADNDLRRAIELHEAPPDMWSHYAILHLQIMDIEGYRLVCRAMQVRFTRPPGSVKFGVSSGSYGMFTVMDANKPFDPVTAATVAWTCALAPNAVTGYDPLSRLNQSFGAGQYFETVLARAEPDAYAGLVRLAQRATAELPRDYVVARACGAILYRAGQYENAVTQFATAARMRREPAPSVWLFLAMAHHQLKHDEEARAWLKEAATWIDQTARKKGPDALEDDLPVWDKLSWYERAALTMLRREADQVVLGKEAKDAFDAALAYHQEAIRLKPNDPVAHYSLGVTLRRKGALGSAVDAFRKALELDGNLAVAHNGLGNALSEQGAHDEAVASLQEAIRRYPRHARFVGDLAGALALKGDLQEAIKAYREAIRLAPPGC
jgi:WD40 repeat protein/tetratricopeptide (TPR) repeat protein/tRNA A-37 threonylcarbamoyl transferase component Bud32